MVSPNLAVRWGAIGLVLSGIMWVVLGLSAMVGYLQAIPGRADVVLFVVALLLFRLSERVVGRVHAIAPHGTLGNLQLQAGGIDPAFTQDLRARLEMEELPG